jgi:hypothetical protein
MTHTGGRPPTFVASRSCLFDHLVGGGQQRLRDGKAERLRRFKVEGQLDPCSLLDRQIGWFLAFENAPGIDAGFSPFGFDPRALQIIR